MDVTRSKWLAKFTTRPMWYFAMAFIAAMAALWVALQIFSTYNSGPGGSPDLKGLEVTSAAVQAIVGTAVVGASAIVALLVAVAALRASEQNNIHNDPDFLLSHQAHSDYQKFGFLYGTMISTYRAQKHESELASYGREETDPEPEIQTPRWNPLVRELKQLLSSTALQVVALKCARVRDESIAKAGHNEHMLRRMTSEVLGALEAQADNHDATLPAGTWMLRVLALTTLLGHELEQGLTAVSKLDSETAKDEDALVGYIHRWSNLSFVRLDPSFGRAVTSTTLAGEAQVALLSGNGGFKSPAEVLTSALTTLQSDRKDWKSGQSTDQDSIGLHRAMRVAALIGDHTTAQDLSATAAAFAKDSGMTPYVANIITKDDVDALRAFIRESCDPAGPPFLVVTVSRRRIPVLFHHDLFNEATRGCIIVDGLRSPYLSWLEKDVQEEFLRITSSKTANKKPRELDLMVQQLARRAYAGDGQWGDPDIGKVKRAFPDLVRSRGHEIADIAQVPALLWVGIDYRQIGVEPPSSDDHWPYEMWSFFGRQLENIAISEELQSISSFSAGV